MEEKPMKCIKNNKTNNIIRVDDVQANQMVGNTWAYVSKTEWKSATRVTESNQSTEEEVKKEETISKKAIRHSKLKEKQRSI
jgi:hypothetical protein